MKNRRRSYHIKNSRGYGYNHDYENGYDHIYSYDFVSRFYKNKKKDRSLVLGLALVVIALAIVTAAKAIPDESDNFTPSYGYQESAYLAEAVQSQKDEEEQETPLISQEDVEVGTIIDEYKGVPVYSNGKNYVASHGLNFSEDGYYFGYKWQCVEFVKRFYYERFGHEMPDGAGHAKYFFNPLLEQGEFNEQRGLYQYKNGGDVKPREDDLLVFDDGAYGHVAIVSAVGDDWLEVIQQNSKYPREKYQLIVEDGTYTVKGDKNPVGWLRKE